MRSLLPHKWALYHNFALLSRVKNIISHFIRYKQKFRIFTCGIYLYLRQFEAVYIALLHGGEDAVLEPLVLAVKCI